MSKEKGKTKKEKGKALLHLCRFTFFLLPFSFATACSSNNRPATRPSSVADRQKAALQDPFGYSPDMDKADISGGKIDHYDRDAMKKDIDHVLNP